MLKDSGRVHRLATPLVIKKSGTCLHVSDGMFGHDFEFKDFGQITVLGIDAEGFITFEVSTPKQQTLIESGIRPERLAIAGSFTLVGQGTAKTSSSSGAKRGTYDYFKRSTDGYFYTVHKLGTKTKKIHLGSLQDPSSDIYQIAIAAQHFPDTHLFDRKEIVPLIKPSQSHGQKLKSALDILVLEGYLDRTESRKRGKVHEEYKTTSKLKMLK
jgi:hypothetical protein